MNIDRENIQQYSIDSIDGISPSDSINGQVPEDQLNVLFLTSMRDILECDQNGRIVTNREGESVYMEGVVERVVRLQNSSREKFLNVVGVIYDDTPDELAKLGDPSPGTDNWIHPPHLKNEQTGTRISEVTHHLPGFYRKLPLADVNGRQSMKAEWEDSIAQIADRLDAHIIISDHLIAKIERLIGPEIGMKGRVLNIHPAVTDEKNPNKLRGLTPTQDAIDRVLTGGHNFTGATLHYVTEGIDEGAPITDNEETLVLPSDNEDPQCLRVENYNKSKLPVLVSGMEHYVRTHWPIIASSGGVSGISTIPLSNSLITTNHHVSNANFITECDRVPSVQQST